MKKVININFQGRVIPIEETAYATIQQYVESLRIHFANEEGKEEIISDIEDRIAELFAETLKKGAPCISDTDVSAIILSMGRPEDFDADDSGFADKAQTSATADAYSGPNFQFGNQRKLYRSENDKIIAGVCSGIANYFNIEPWLIRILFIILPGMSVIVYFALWIAVPSSASQVIGSTRKRLFRNPDGKIIAGVCSGISQYFGISVWIPRLIFLIPFISFVFKWSHVGWFSFPHFLSLSFSPGATIIYIILWIVLPEARSASEKLEMKGEKVDLNSIKNTVSEDLKGFQERLQKMGREASEYAKSKSQDFTTTSSFQGADSSLNRVVKVIVYIILITVYLAVTAAAFGIAVAATGLLPVKDFVITDGWQNILAWTTLLLFFWVPVVAFLTAAIRRLAGKRTSSSVKISFSGLWTLGLISAILLVASIVKDFKHKGRIEENVNITTGAFSTLEIKSTSDYYSSDGSLWLKIEPFANNSSDSIKLKNVRVRVFKSTDSLYHAKLLKFAKGASRAQAMQNAGKIEFTVEQDDSTLKVSNGFGLSTDQKFRDQYVELFIYVPVGKRIRINENVSHGRVGTISLGNESWRWNDMDDELDYDFNRTYEMTIDGLKSLGADEPNPSDKFEEDNEYEYRYDESVFSNLKSFSKSRYRINVRPSEREVSRDYDFFHITKSTFLLSKF